MIIIVIIIINNKNNSNDPNSNSNNNKQLLDEVLVISRIIKVEVGVISRSRRLRLITLTEKKKGHNSK